MLINAQNVFCVIMTQRYECLSHIVKYFVYYLRKYFLPKGTPQYKRRFSLILSEKRRLY
jgi:hypothetical protein